MATAYQWSGRGSVRANDELLQAAQPERAEAPKPRLIARPTVPVAGRHKKPLMVEFYTVKKIDNSRLVRRVEPIKTRNLYKTLALGSVIAAFFMLYVYQHFRCIDLGFQLEDLKSKAQQARTLNSELKLQIAYLRDPERIDLIARRHLGLTQPTAGQVREYAIMDKAEVAAVQEVRPNRAP
jgi:cell division protein FtsL